MHFAVIIDTMMRSGNIRKFGKYRVIDMKICKNCGHQTDDGKVRCPKCGYLFEEDMDAVLRQMKDNLNNYKKEIALQQTVQQSAAVQPAPAAAADRPVQESMPAGEKGTSAEKERFELLSEVAQLKGELRALSSEVTRIQAQRDAMQQAVLQPQQPGQPTTVIYAQPYSAQPSAPVPQEKAYENGPKAKSGLRSGNRIFISIVCILALAASIGMFFLQWIDGEFKGVDALTYLFGAGGSDFGSFLDNTVRGYDYAGVAFIANASEQFCYYVLRYGIVVYAALLVLGFPLLFSMFGRVKMRGWHRFFAWTSFILAAILFGIFSWVSGFSTVTTWFMIGAAANFVRCFFLFFYRKSDKLKGGLEG